MTEVRTPWGVAKEEGKTVIGRVFGPMVGVYYPYRRTGDLYVAVKGHPVHSGGRVPGARERPQSSLPAFPRCHHRPLLGRASGSTPAAPTEQRRST